MSTVGPPAPDSEPAPAPADSSAFDTAEAVIRFVIDHWVFFAPVAAYIAATLLWNQWRTKQQAVGKGVRPLAPILRDFTRFITKEDRGPVLTKPAFLAKRVRALTWRRLYAVLALTALAWALTGHGPGPTALLLLAFFTTTRAKKVFRARQGIVRQMFEVAAGECKYPRGTELAPWQWVNVQNWEDLYRPGATIVTYPARYDSEDIRTRQKFERQFNGTVSDEHSWTYTWESSKNRVVCTPTPFLPSKADYPGIDPHPWNIFPLGLAGGGKEAFLDVTMTPHVLVCGPTGSGKSVVQRIILLHALQSPDWRIVGIDPKRVEMTFLEGRDNVLKIARDLHDGVEVIEDVEAEMKRRYERMEAEGVNHFTDLNPRPPALMCMIDEAFAFLSPEGIKSDEGKERDELHARAAVLIGSIARLGRAAGCHLALAAQRPDAKILAGELKNNLDCRIAAGRMDNTPSLMVLDDEAATRLPSIKGRGMIRMPSGLTEFQGYFIPVEALDAVIAASRARREAAAGAPVIDGELAGDDSGGKRRRGLRLPSVPGLSGAKEALARRAAAAAENDARLAAGAVPPGGDGGYGGGEGEPMPGEAEAYSDVYGDEIDDSMPGGPVPADEYVPLPDPSGPVPAGVPDDGWGSPASQAPLPPPAVSGQQPAAPRRLPTAPFVPPPAG